MFSVDSAIAITAEKDAVQPQDSIHIPKKEECPHHEKGNLIVSFFESDSDLTDSQQMIELFYCSLVFITLQKSSFVFEICKSLTICLLL